MHIVVSRCGQIIKMHALLYLNTVFAHTYSYYDIFGLLLAVQ